MRAHRELSRSHPAPAVPLLLPLRSPAACTRVLRRCCGRVRRVPTRRRRVPGAVLRRTRCCARRGCVQLLLCLESGRVACKRVEEASPKVGEKLRVAKNL